MNLTALCYAFLGGLKGVWRGLEKSDNLCAGLIESGMTPQIPKWKLKSSGIAPGAAALRPWKFQNNVKATDLADPKKVLQEKINGVLAEVYVDKDGRVEKVVSARGEKTNFLPCLPELQGKVLDASVRDSKIYVEVFHPKGNSFCNGLVHSAPEKAAEAIRVDGHPKLFVLAVHKLGGFDTSNKKYEDMRSLNTLVAQKLPHGMVPDQSDGTVFERGGFVDRIRKENEGLPIQKADGVIVYPKEAPNKGAVLLRQKFPVSGKFVVMGMTDSTKMADSVASLSIGDGKKVLGKVNVADPGMRTTIKLNPDRYLNKVALVEFKRRTATGNLIEPVLKRFLFAEPPTAVPEWKEEKKAG